MAQVAPDRAVEKATVTTNGRRITVGDFELTMFSDGNYWLDGGPLFGIIPKALWLKKAACDEKNRVVLGLNSLLIRGGKQTVLVETGIGNKFDDRVRKVYEPEARLLGNLTAAGVAPDSIEVVINTTCTSTTAAGTRCAPTAAWSPHFRAPPTTPRKASGSTARSSTCATASATSATTTTRSSKAAR